MKRRIKLTLAYDGSAYHGWQVQPGVRTIQGELERALGSVLDQSVGTAGSGRTDAGVHAAHQVAHFETDRSMETGVLMRALNALLPPDVRILEAEEVDPAFHARISAKSKTYEYRIWRNPVVSPFQYTQVYGLWQPLDSGAMERATPAFVGVHDFTSFSTAAASVQDRTREVFSAGWDHGSVEWVFRIRANGFLQSMVRTIVGTLLEVGRGRISSAEIPKIFEARDRSRAGPSAPARGLHLVDVEYE